MNRSISKDKYINMLQDVFSRFRPRIESASSKGGWDPIFKTKNPSQYDIIRQRDEALRQVILEAKMFGIDLRVVDPDEYKSEFDGKVIE